MERFSEYRIMWVLCFFDLPTETTEERKRHTEFRKDLLRDGFTRFQLSIYTRCCPSSENAEVHIKRIKGFIPPEGNVSILCITDKQFAKIEVIVGKKARKPPKPSDQLTLF